MYKQNTAREKFKTSTLTVYLNPGIKLSIQAEGRLCKKARRAALLLILRTLKKEVRFMAKATLFHDDSSILRGLYDSLKEVSLYQSTDIQTPEERFGHKVRAMRTGLNITQKEFALLVGKQSTYLCRIERGRHKLNQLDQARIMNVLTSLYLQKPVYELPPLIENPL